MGPVVRLSFSAGRGDARRADARTTPALPMVTATCLAPSISGIGEARVTAEQPALIEVRQKQRGGHYGHDELPFVLARDALVAL